ncbi:MAG: FAD-dependent thymidylate synthase [Candidatus Hodarchaeales archaeon]
MKKGKKTEKNGINAPSKENHQTVNVELITCLPKPDYHSTLAAVNCYSPGRQLLELREIASSKKNLLDKVIKSGHLSIIEFTFFVFYISGIDRATSHQLVRHRIASYAQQSQRYVDASNFNYAVPESVRKMTNTSLKNSALLHVENSFKLYDKLVKSGIPKEDARFLLPNATKTNIIVGMNARSLMNFFDRRCCYRSQRPIREIANKMLALCRQEAPIIFKNAGPYCKRYGYCPEENKCSQMKNIPRLADLLENYHIGQKKDQKSDGPGGI